MSDATLTLGAAPADAGGRARVRAAFEAEEQRSLARGLKLRLVALAIISAWLMVEGDLPGVAFYLAFMPLFALSGALHLALERLGYGGAAPRYLMPLFDIALISFIFFVPNPLEDNWDPAAMKLRFGNEVYYYVLVAGSIVSYAPRVVLWTGALAALGWTLGALWVIALPETTTDVATPILPEMSEGEKIALLVDPNRVIVGWVVKQVIVVMIVAGILAAFVDRARHLVASQAEAERERSNLARYFSPNLVDDLATTDEPLGRVRTQEVAVLFVDIVGFTRLSEEEPPEAVIALLRDFHARMEQAVFAHGGTLDKYLGDGLMATFGTPWPGPRDAANGLACARAMVETMAAWNQERARQGRAAVHIGVGVHYGPVVLGDVGGAARLEFAVLGDTVNVASRLERLTRELGAAVVVSEAVIAGARRGEADPGLLAAFEKAATQALRGRGGALEVWTLPAGEVPVIG